MLILLDTVHFAGSISCELRTHTQEMVSTAEAQPGPSVQFSICLHRTAFSRAHSPSKHCHGPGALSTGEVTAALEKFMFTVGEISVPRSSQRNAMRLREGSQKAAVEDGS